MEKNIKNKSFSPAISIGLAGIVLVGVVVFLIFLNISTTKEAAVIINSQTFEIKGMYGNSFSFKDVTSIELKDTIPTVGMKTNGAGLGETKKGYFEVDGIGECLLFIHINKGPYLYIKAGNRQIIINYKDEEKTKQIYQTMMASWNN